MKTGSLPIPVDESLQTKLWTQGDSNDRQNQPKGVVLLVHGLGDHCGRYQAFAARWVDKGYAIFGFDLPGHGLSPGRRGSPRSYDAILQTIASARERLQDHFPGVNQYLIGHSMGGNLAINYTLRRNEFDRMDSAAPAGVILAAPMLMPPQLLDRQKIFAAWGTGQLFRWIRISKPVEPEQLSKDPESTSRRSNDALGHSHISLYLATQLLAQGRYALDHARHVDVPTLVLLGDEDELVDPAACRNLALRMLDRGDYLLWPRGRHDLLNDLDADVLDKTIRQWIDSKTVSPIIKLRLATSESIIVNDPGITVLDQPGR